MHPQLLSREQKIDEMIVAAQTRSYDTAITLGQRGVRYVTGLIMDNAVRAPALMQDIIAGNVGETNNPPQQRFQPGTIRFVALCLFVPYQNHLLQIISSLWCGEYVF